MDTRYSNNPFMEQMDTMHSNSSREQTDASHSPKFPMEQTDARHSNSSKKLSVNNQAYQYWEVFLEEQTDARHSLKSLKEQMNTRHSYTYPKHHQGPRSPGYSTWMTLQMFCMAVNWWTL